MSSGLQSRWSVGWCWTRTGSSSKPRGANQPRAERWIWASPKSRSCCTGPSGDSSTADATSHCSEVYGEARRDVAFSGTEELEHSRRRVSVYAGGKQHQLMYAYLIRRLAAGALTVIGVSIVVFFVLRVLPGDPLVAVFGMEGFTKLSAAERAGYMAQLGLSDPLPVQYLHWLRDIAAGSFGHSFFRAESVAEMIGRRGPLTAEIALISVILSWLVGIPVAIVSALRPNSVGDNIARLISILFLAVPGFWLGMLIVRASLFWFGYRAPLTGPSLLADPWGNLQIII